jgi:hypothetical protein
MEALEDEADALAAHARLFVGRQGGHVAPFQPVGAGVGAVEQAEQVEQGRFAGAGRAHHGDVFAGVDAQVQPGQRVDRGVAELEARSMPESSISAMRLLGLGFVVRRHLGAGLDAFLLERGDDALAGLQPFEHSRCIPSWRGRP